jgi:hypothetical protein
MGFSMGLDAQGVSGPMSLLRIFWRHDFQSPQF